ncbi:methyltransferase type 12 [Endozoicomonas sp. OPT23]|uniref:class I SAM-dependent methyltransferase n=1 Tax=Endozoicomonas sp. OPT23 TaxID=2072845 RepID=UPI00129A2FBA|nr:class I SAM-dependent methyltransferase [Endozoicomonas sp. OPT23]MRI33520.1 methyltransferase type 12 [Endozoicomonas sp. OPT23]
MTAPPSQQAVQQGQAVYSKKILNIYDWLVLRISNPFIWRCRTAHIKRLYEQNLSVRHLDVGVGTGYFLDKCSFPVSYPELVLLDMNLNCLEETSQRVMRYHPVSHQINILEPLNVKEQPFQSIAVNYLLHCLPGSIATKSVVFDHLLPYLAKDGVIFGSTLLNKGGAHNFFSRRLMSFYNDKGIFHNTEDSLEELEAALAKRFKRYELKVYGVGVLFKAWNPIALPPK